MRGGEHGASEPISQFDCIGGPKHGRFGDTKWNGGCQSATKVGEGAVIVELAIPYQTLRVVRPVSLANCCIRYRYTLQS